MDDMRVFDLHCDTLDRLSLHDFAAYTGFAEENAKEGIPVGRMMSLRDNDAHISLERMGRHPWCECFAIFVADGLADDMGWAMFERVRAFFEEQMRLHGDVVEQVRQGREIEAVLAAGKKVALLTVEGAPFLQGAQAYERLDALARAGVMMVTLTWNGKNAIASGNVTQEGMSPFGREMVRELEERRIIVDASHLNDASLADLFACAQRPFVASHSNARSVCKNLRNLKDWQFLEIAQRGGIVGLNLYNAFLVEGNREASPADVLRHIEHWLELGGQGAIALGSDYDGADVPSWLKGCDKLKDLYELVKRAFGDEIARGLFFDNALRFFSSFA